MDPHTITTLPGWQIALLLWAACTTAVCLWIWWAAEHAPYEHEIWPNLKPQAPDIEKLAQAARPKHRRTRTEDWLDKLQENLPTHWKRQAD